MIEPSVIPAPHTFPFACVGCLGQKGPMIDQYREIPGFGHVFVCRNCAKTYARMFGFSAGEKLDELSQVAETVSGLERELESLREQLGTLVLERDDELRRHNETKDELALSRTRVKQLEERITEEARMAIALVGDVA